MIEFNIEESRIDMIDLADPKTDVEQLYKDFKEHCINVINKKYEHEQQEDIFWFHYVHSWCGHKHIHIDINALLRIWEKAELVEQIKMSDFVYRFLK